MRNASPRQKCDLFVIWREKPDFYRIKNTGFFKFSLILQLSRLKDACFKGKICMNATVHSMATAPVRVVPELIQAAGMHAPALIDKVPGVGTVRRKAEDWFAEASCRNALRSIPPGFFISVSDKGAVTWAIAGGMMAVATLQLWFNTRYGG